jgi:hypothetical protein
MRSRALGAIPWVEEKKTRRPWSRRKIRMGLCAFLVRFRALEVSLGEEKEQGEEAIQCILTSRGLGLLRPPLEKRESKTRTLYNQRISV